MTYSYVLVVLKKPLRRLSPRLHCLLLQLWNVNIKMIIKIFLNVFICMVSTMTSNHLSKQCHLVH